MASGTLSAAAKAFAEELGAVLWDGIPLGGPEVVWPDADVGSFLNKIRPLAPKLVYLSPDSDVIAVAIAGVVHVFDPEEQRFGDEPGSPGLGDFFYSVNEVLDPTLQELAKQIAADERFDGHRAADLIDELGMEVDPSLYREIGWAAQRLFEEGVGAQLEKESRGIVRELIKHPDFDPLVVDVRDEGGHTYIDEAVVGRDPRLKRMVQRGLQQAAWEHGLRDKAEREVKEEATRLMKIIPPLVLDRVGFAARSATREALLAPFLDSVVERRRGITGEWIKRLDGDVSQGRREVRYAVAAQRLLAIGMTKRAIAMRLQLSPSTLDRLLSFRTSASYEFQPDDPIVVELAPELNR